MNPPVQQLATLLLQAQTGQFNSGLRQSAKEVRLLNTAMAAMLRQERLQQQSARLTVGAIQLQNSSTAALIRQQRLAERQANATGSAWRSMFRGAAGGMRGMLLDYHLLKGAIADVGRLGAAFLNVSRNAEKTRFNLALLRSDAQTAGLDTKMDTGGLIQWGESTRKWIREEAARTPAGFQDLQETFQLLYFPGKRANASDEQIKQLSSAVATREAMAPLGQKGVMARDVEQLMRGEIGRIQTQVLRDSRKQIQALVKSGDDAGAFDLIMKKLTVPEGLYGKFAQGFEAQFEGAKSKLAELAEIAGKPLFTGINQGLKELLVWAEKNKVKINEIAQAVGVGLYDAVKVVADLVGGLASAFSLVAEGGIPAIIAAIPLIGLALTALMAHPFFAAMVGVAALFAYWDDITAPIDASNLARRYIAAEPVAKTAAEKFMAWGGGPPKSALSKLISKLGPAGISPIFASGDYLSDYMLAQNLIADVANASADGGRIASARKYTADMARQFQKDYAPTALREGAEGVVGGIGRTLGGWLDLFGKEKDLKKAGFNIDARHANVTQHITLDTDEPGMFLGGTMQAALDDIVTRPDSWRAALGAINVATGRP